MTGSPSPAPSPSPVASPSAAELRRRSSLPRQALRFVVLNLKIFKLSRQHH